MELFVILRKHVVTFGCLRPEAYETRAGRLSKQFFLRRLSTVFEMLTLKWQNYNRNEKRDGKSFLELRQKKFYPWEK